MNTLEMCGDILQPGGKLGTPGLVNDGNNYTSKWKTKSTFFYSLAQIEATNKLKIMTD